MSSQRSFVTNLELRESNTDGTEGAGLSHTAEGLFLLHVLELAADGDPRGAVTIVHDAGEHGARYESLANRFADAGWAVALPDLRGHGNSEGERGHCWGLPEPVRDIDSIQDHLAYQMPDAPKALVGVGLGALYSLAFALKHPGRVSALVLISPILKPAFQPLPKKGGLKGLFNKPKPTDPGVLGFTPEQLFNDAGAQSAYRGDSLVHDVVTRHTVDILPGQASSVLGQVGSLGTPTLILHGADDPLSAPADSSVIASAETRVIDGARHGLLHEASGDQTAADIVAWVDGQAS
ncbi:MAG: alpha/beta fold hydrolase [Planctomycetota bacterium]|jgi:alpha-beta hydrolase superfamily lysophospholipase